MSLISGVVSGVIRPPVRSTLSKGVGAPSGYVFLIDADGAILKDQDGAYLMERA